MVTRKPFVMVHILIGPYKESFFVMVYLLKSDYKSS